MNTAQARFMNLSVVAGSVLCFVLAFLLTKWLEGNPETRKEAQHVAEAQDRPSALEPSSPDTSGRRAAIEMQAPSSQAPPGASELRPDKPNNPSVVGNDVDPEGLPESSLKEMKYKHEAIRAELAKRSAPIIVQQFQDGLREHISDDPVWRPSSADNESADIFGIESIPGHGINRTVLQRWQYPDLYKMKDDLLRLSTLIEHADSQDSKVQKR